MTQVTVRRATLDDVKAIVALWRELMAVHYQVAPLVWTLSDDAEERYREHLGNMMQDPDRCLLVAEQEGTVVGYFVAQRGTRPPVLVPARRGVCEEICVASSARRRGVGKALVAEAMRWFESEGLPMAEVGYATDNPMSVPFWEGLGFRPYRITATRSLAPDATRRATTFDGAPYFASVAESYDRLQPVVAGPSYEAGLAFVLDLIPHQGRDVFTCVELGCGTATLSRRVLDRFPGAKVAAVDSEPEMLELARHKLAPYGERAEVREGDMTTCDVPTCDLALSSFVFHHIRPEKLSEVFGRVAAALSPGGSLIVLDTINVGPRWGGRIGAQNKRLYEQRVAAAVAGGQVTEEEIDARWELRRRMTEEGKDVECRHHADDLLRLMQEAGFSEVGLVWRMFASTIVMGFVPRG